MIFKNQDFWLRLEWLFLIIALAAMVTFVQKTSEPHRIEKKTITIELTQKFGHYSSLLPVLD